MSKINKGVFKNLLIAGGVWRSPEPHAGRGVSKGLKLPAHIEEGEGEEVTLNLEMGPGGFLGQFWKAFFYFLNFIYSKNRTFLA